MRRAVHVRGEVRQPLFQEEVTAAVEELCLLDTDQPKIGFMHERSDRAVRVSVSRPPVFAARRRPGAEVDRPPEDHQIRFATECE